MYAVKIFVVTTLLFSGVRATKILKRWVVSQRHSVAVGVTGKP